MFAWLPLVWQHLVVGAFVVGAVFALLRRMWHSLAQSDCGGSCHGCVRSRGAQSPAPAEVVPLEALQHRSRPPD